MDRMSETTRREPVLLSVYERFLGDHDTIGFVHAIKQRYRPHTLERLTTHGNSRLRCAAVMALGFIGGYEVNATLGRAMSDEERAVRLSAYNACRRVWNRVGDQTQQQRLVEIIRANAAKHYGQALEQATALITDDPRFAEAWYQRGSAWFQLDDFPQAIFDWRKTLELNPYHFVAATAIGEAYLRRGNPRAALEAFRHALHLNRDLEKLRKKVAEIARQLDEA